MLRLVCSWARSEDFLKCGACKRRRTLCWQPEVWRPHMPSYCQAARRVQVSGRAWKQPSVRANKLRNPKLSSSWEKKMAEKAVSKAYQEAKQAALQAKKEAKQVRLVCVRFRACSWALLWLVTVLCP